MVILIVLYRYQMSRKLSHNKILDLFKVASEEELLVAWRKSHPTRYSDDESGLNAWKQDTNSILGVTDESDLLSILEGEVNPDLLARVSDWSDISYVIPAGNSLRKKWQKSSDNKSLSGFIGWLRGLGHRDASTILNSIVPKKVESIKPPSDVPKSEENVSFKKVDLQGGSDDAFYRAILEGIGAPVTNNNMAYLYAWRQSEGGKAAFNPFNTTQKAEGATNYNSVGVKNYTSAEQGVAATVKTIINGRYESIINSLKMDKPPMETAEALVASPWGTSGLIKKVISGYEAGYSPKPKEINQSTERIA